MIGKIAGRLDYRGTDHVLIDTGGVGYVVHCSERTLATMPPPGGAVALFTDMLVREDLIQLYGFATLAEREWHRLLTSVQGVSARGGLAILGALGADGVGRAIALGDVASIRRAPGIGPKIAERIVLELKSRAPAVMAMGGAGARPATAPGRTGASALVETAEPVAPPAAADEGAAEAQSDALSALVHLGYAQGEAAAAVATAAAEGIGDPAALIRAALRRLAPQG